MTGCCSVCHYRRRLREDGTLGKHVVYTGTVARVCEGTGKPDAWAEQNRLAQKDARWREEAAGDRP